MNVSTIAITILEALDDLDNTDEIKADTFGLTQDDFEYIIELMNVGGLVLGVREKVDPSGNYSIYMENRPEITLRGAKYLYEMKALKLALKQ